MTPADIRPSTMATPSVPRVPVDEAGVHDRGARSEVRAQPNPVGVGDPDTGGHHVVGHPRELVDTQHLDRSLAAQRQSGLLELLDRARADRRPHHVRHQVEDALEVEAARWRQAVREQVQAQVDVGRVGGRLVQIDLGNADVRGGRCGRTRPPDYRSARPDHAVPRRPRAARRVAVRGTRCRGTRPANAPPATVVVSPYPHARLSLIDVLAPLHPTKSLRDPAGTPKVLRAPTRLRTQCVSDSLRKRRSCPPR